MNWIFSQRDALYQQLNKMSKVILEYIYYYANYDIKHNRIYKDKQNNHKKKKRIVYYEEINIFNIFMVIATLGLLLLLTILYSKNCPNILSFTNMDRIAESFNCNTFVILFISTMLIMISYIIGGPIRLILIIGFFALSIIIITKPKNIDTIVTFGKTITQPPQPTNNFFI